MYFLMTFEYLKSDLNEDAHRYRVSPGFQYFPWQRFEFRAEIVNFRTFNDDTTTPVSQDSWHYIGQIHLWF